MQEIKTIHTSDESDFDNEVNTLLTQGWRVSSTNCFANSDCCSYQAILLRETAKASSQVSDGTMYNTGGMITNGGGPCGEIHINVDPTTDTVEAIQRKIADMYRKGHIK